MIRNSLVKFNPLSFIKTFVLKYFHYLSLVNLKNVNSTYPETRPIPAIIPPAGTSSFPYNSYAANWDNSKKGVLQENQIKEYNYVIQLFGWREENVLACNLKIL